MIATFYRYNYHNHGFRIDEDSTAIQDWIRLMGKPEGGFEVYGHVQLEPIDRIEARERGFQDFLARMKAIGPHDESDEQVRKRIEAYAERHRDRIDGYSKSQSPTTTKSEG